MARVGYNVCDKCGKKLNVNTLWLATKPYRIRMAFKTIFGFTDREYDFELCDECGIEVKNYIKAWPKKVQNEQNKN
ncbi:MAG: hypothetical protein FWB95_02690 [Treponema sp.]|nr:hypothetical protein [Treponema sp.]